MSANETLTCDVKSKFKPMGAGGEPMAIRSSEKTETTELALRPVVVDNDDKNEVLAAICLNNATESIFINNSVTNVQATTEAIARASLIIGKTCERSLPVEWEKIPEAIGRSVFTISKPEKFYDLEILSMMIERKELLFLLPLKSTTENRRIIFAGMGNHLLGKQAAREIRQTYLPSRWAEIFCEVEGADWCEFFLLFEISEEELENSFPGLCKSKNWLRYMRKIDYLTKKETKANVK
jgi:hypothetical protein